MMRVDMTPILTDKADRISFSFDWEDASSYFPDFSFDKPVHVEGEVSKRSECMFLTLHADVSYKTVCARCLKELRRTLSLEAVRNIVDQKAGDEENDEAVSVSGSEILLDEPTSELLFLELPSRDLCSDNCLGICPKCGKNRNEGDCGCSAVKEIDPRLEGLKRFLVDESENS